MLSLTGPVFTILGGMCSDLSLMRRFNIWMISAREVFRGSMPNIMAVRNQDRKVPAKSLLMAGDW